MAVILGIESHDPGTVTILIIKWRSSLIGIWRNLASAPWLWPGDRYYQVALHAGRRKPSWPSVKGSMNGYLALVVGGVSVHQSP